MRKEIPYLVALAILLAILALCSVWSRKEGWKETMVPTANTDAVAFCGNTSQVAVVAYKTDTSPIAKPTFRACYDEGVSDVNYNLFMTNAKIEISAPRDRAVKLYTGSAGSGSVIASLPNLDPKVEVTTSMTLVDSSFRSIEVTKMEVVTSVTSPAGVEALKNVEPETGKETYSTTFPNCPGKVVVTRAGTTSVYGCYTSGLTNVNAAFMGTNRFTNIRVPVGGSAILYSGTNGTGNIVASLPVSGKADPNVVEKANLTFKSIRVTLPGSSMTTTTTTTTAPVPGPTPQPSPPPPNPSPAASDLNATQILAIQNLKPTAALCSETFSRITNQIPVSSQTSYVPSVQTCNQNYPVVPSRGAVAQPLIGLY